MKKQKTIIFISIAIVILLLVLFFIIFSLKSNKFQNFGNTMSNKSVKEIEEYILNISSYEAKIEVTVKSNKNTNAYCINQKYMQPNIAKQEILEPSNIEGLQTIYDGNQLQIINSKLKANTIYENYPYMAENDLWLSSFCEDYKKDDKSICEENENEIIMQTSKRKQDNLDPVKKTLKIDKKTGKPTELTIKDSNEKNTVYILYKEIKINGLKREEVLAFKQVEQKRTSVRFVIICPFCSLSQN